MTVIFGTTAVATALDQFGPLAGNAFVFIFLADYKSRNILKKQEGDLPEIANLNKMGTFQRCFGGEESVVGNDPYRETQDTGISCHQGCSPISFEFLQFAPIDQSLR